MKKFGLVATIILILLNGCSSTKLPKSNKITNKIEASNTPKVIYSQIYSKISANDLDEADNLYIQLKTNYENSSYIPKAAQSLAIVHMEKEEYILANFYLQETLSINSSDEFSKFLLVKNQFLAAVKNQRDNNYMQKALKALELNRNLVSSNDYSILANSMLTRVKLDMIYQNREIGVLYKKLDKDKASKLYLNRVNELGLEVKNIYKP